MLNARLAALAAHIRPHSRLADVGTDHAYLPIYAVQHRICPFAIATDIVDGPVESATAHVKDSGLSEQISVRKGDGLSTVSPDEVDDIVIAGMGGEQIASILQAASFVRNPHYRLLLQPMSRVEKLREYLLTNGFEIEQEEVVRKGRQLYNILCVSFADAKPITDRAVYYIGALAVEGNAYYWEQLCARLEKQIDGLTAGGELTRAEEERTLLFRVRNYVQKGILL